MPEWRFKLSQKENLGNMPQPMPCNLLVAESEKVKASENEN
jgi:hypothetical protein